MAGYNRKEDADDRAALRRLIRKRALRHCYDSGMFDNQREVDANPNHPIVLEAWERAKRELSGA